MSELPVALYVVATPLGNLGDLSERARETLSRVSFIAGESQKVCLRWLEILAPHNPPDWDKPGLLSYRESQRDRDAKKILERLSAGHSVALISDAGTPAISDPGWHIVRQVQEEDIQVVAIPGPCAAISALSVCGFPTRQFLFEGFLPHTGRLRRDSLERVMSCTHPVVLYESPHKILQTLQDLAELSPERDIFVYREMTKKFEESWIGPLSEAHTDWQTKTIKGEFTLVVGPWSEPTTETELPQESIDFVKSLELPTKKASALLHHFHPGISKKVFYKELTR